MEIRYSTHFRDAKKYDTKQLREEFLIDGLFKSGEITLIYSHVDRMITGAACPTNMPLPLVAGDELRSDYFLERRELGIINIGGPGTIKADNQEFRLKARDGLYIGMGTKEVCFSSEDESNPAKFYLNSVPAHATHPTVHIDISQAEPARTGRSEDANLRTIYKYIHPLGVKSCQLVMGLTMLEPGSVWNTMPCHTHERRMEVYLYFDMLADTVVFHYMGRPDETRHLVLRNEQAVISPSWSIHSGCGTKNYSFIWGMAGENQVFSDMDAVTPEQLR